MNTTSTLEPVFVDEIPDELNPGAVYISIAYDTVVHLCCCGCGSEVVTPLHPTRWKLTYDGVTVSLHPSIGSWGLPCQAHYVIKESRVIWAGAWSPTEIEAVRESDRRVVEDYFSLGRPNQMGSKDDGTMREPATALQRLWRRLRTVRR